MFVFLVNCIIFVNQFHEVDLNEIDSFKDYSLKHSNAMAKKAKKTAKKAAKKPAKKAAKKKK